MKKILTASQEGLNGHLSKTPNPDTPIEEQKNSTFTVQNLSAVPNAANFHEEE
jgi:hypothetical protein